MRKSKCQILIKLCNDNKMAVDLAHENLLVYTENSVCANNLCAACSNII